MGGNRHHVPIVPSIVPQRLSRAESYACEDARLPSVCEGARSWRACELRESAAGCVSTAAWAVRREAAALPAPPSPCRRGAPAMATSYNWRAIRAQQRNAELRVTPPACASSPQEDDWPRADGGLVHRHRAEQDAAADADRRAPRGAGGATAAAAPAPASARRRRSAGSGGRGVVVLAAAAAAGGGRHGGCARRRRLTRTPRPLSQYAITRIRSFYMRKARGGARAVAAPRQRQRLAQRPTPSRRRPTAPQPRTPRI